MKKAKRLLSVALSVLLTLGLLAVGTVPAGAAPAFSTTPMVARGSEVAVALHSDGTLWSGYMGNFSTPAMPIYGIDRVVSLLLGSPGTVVAQRYDGTVWEIVPEGDFVTQQQIDDLDDIVALATSLRPGELSEPAIRHTLAIRTDGTVWSWDRNRTLPASVLGPENAKAVALSDWGVFSVALCGEDDVWLWRSGNYTAERVPGLTNITAISMDVHEAIWALRGDGVLLSVQTLGGDVSLPEQVLDDVSAISGIFALRNDGSVWRHGSVHQEELSNIIAIADAPSMCCCGYFQALALDSDGYVWSASDYFDYQRGFSQVQGSDPESWLNLFVPLAIIPVTGITIAGNATRNLNTGATLNFSATVAPANATNRNVSWSSSNRNVVTVNANGRVTAVAPGNATITARTECGRTAQVTITVEQPTNLTWLWILLGVIAALLATALGVFAIVRYMA